MSSRLWMILILTVSLVGCDSTDVAPANELLVVEAFLYAGESVDDITLSRVIPLNSDETIPAAVNDAVVTLSKGATIYSLVSTGTDGIYTYPGSDLVVEAGDVFELVIETDGAIIRAETQVPIAPAGTTISVSEVVVPELEIGAGPGQGPRQNPGALREFFQSEANAISVTWDNDVGDAYFVAIRTPEAENPDFILPEFIRDRFGGIEIITQPTTANFFDIRLFSLEVIGEYTATVYRINQEYVDLYLNREQDSRDLNEPPTNIDGGLGVFSAFSRQEVRFELVRE